MNNWKIGAVAGLIAGIIGSMISFFFVITMLNIEIPYYGLEQLSFIPINRIIIGEIVLNLILWIMLGIIYSRAYDLIPGKGISKGLIFGLIYYLIWSVRWIVFYAMYGWEFMGLVYSIVIYVPLGLIIGIVYEFLSKRYITRKEKPVAVKYDLMGVIYPGAIAGLIGGIGAFFYTSVIINPLLWPKLIIDIGFLMSQLGSHVLFNIVWGIVFGILFARFYDKVPRKGVLKGLIFGIVLYFIINFQVFLHRVAYGQLIIGLWSLLAIIFVYVPFGLVLGLLYRRPTEAIAVKKEKTRLFKIENCKHCGSSIPKGSRFCKECGKKQ